MGEQRRVRVTFSKRTGKVKTENFGFHGPSCSEQTKFIEDALGKVTNVTQKEEYYEAEIEVDNEVHRGLCG